MNRDLRHGVFGTTQVSKENVIFELRIQGFGEELHFQNNQSLYDGEA